MLSDDHDYNDYAEFRDLFIVVLIFIMMSGVIMNVVMLSVVVLSVVSPGYVCKRF